MAEVRDIGIDVQPPEGSCEDPQCPFHGTLPVRGQTIDGRIAATRATNSVVVLREYLHPVPKYDRYEKRSSRYTAHKPPCMTVAPGDEVTIMECRPISKTKKFVVIEAREGAPDIVIEDYTEAEGLEIETPPADEDEEELEEGEVPPEARLGGEPE